MEPEDELLLGVVGGPLCQSVVDPDGAVQVLVSSGLAQGSRSGHLLNSILLTSQNERSVRFQQTHNQSLRQLFLMVSWDLLSFHAKPDGVLVFL